MPAELPEDLARQSLGRPLTELEVALAAALTGLFERDIHDLGEVARLLQQQGVLRPSGDTAPWNLETLEEELRAINASLDEAHERGGITRVSA